MPEISLYVELPNNVSRCEGWIYDHEDAEKDIPCSVRNECARFTANSGNGGRYLLQLDPVIFAQTSILSPPEIKEGGCALKMEIPNG